MLTGGTSADTFIVTAGKDTITDFVLGSDALTVTKGTGTANVNVKFADGTSAIYNVIGNATTDVTIPATVKTKADLDKIAGVAAGSLVLVDTDNSVSNYQYQISNFSKGDVLNFPDGANVTLKNTNPTDGKIEIDWIQNQQTVAVQLTGLSTEQDLAVLSVGEFNQLFGDNSIQ
ncbi:MAG: hypothetical protein PHQ03_07740 [Methylococcales bacterium]|nr:hypothetical protein [Methylococcales bacterium]